MFRWYADIKKSGAAAVRGSPRNVKREIAMDSLRAVRTEESYVCFWTRCTRSESNASRVSFGTVEIDVKTKVCGFRSVRRRFGRCGENSPVLAKTKVFIRQRGNRNNA